MNQLGKHFYPIHPGWLAVVVFFAVILPFDFTAVEGDPHFIINLPKSNMDICFNIDSKPGHILNLVSDPGTGNFYRRLPSHKKIGLLFVSHVFFFLFSFQE